MIKMSSASRTGYPGFFLTFLKRGTCPILLSQFLSLFVVSPGWNGGNGCCCWSRSGLSGSDIEQDARLTPWYTLTHVSDRGLCSYIFGYGSKKKQKTGMDRSAVIPTCGRNELRIGGLIRTYCQGRYTKLAGYKWYKYNLPFLGLDQEYGSGLRIACGSSIGALHGLSSVLRIPLVFCGSTFDLCSQGTMWWCCKAFCAMGGFLFRDWHFHTFRCDRIRFHWVQIYCNSSFNSDSSFNPDPTLGLLQRAWTTDAAPSTNRTDVQGQNLPPPPWSLLLWTCPGSAAEYSAWKWSNLQQIETGYYRTTSTNPNKHTLWNLLNILE